MFALRKPSTPQHDLLIAVQKNEHDKIIKIAKENPETLKKSYDKEYRYKTILQIACSSDPEMDNVQPQTIEKLIDLGANPTERNSHDLHWQALHYAAVSAKPEIIKVIVSHLDALQLRVLVRCPQFLHRRYDWTKAEKIPGSYSNNALHVILKYGKKDSPAFAKAVSILVNAGLDIDDKDTNGVSSRNLIEKLNLKIEEDIANKDNTTHKTDSDTNEKKPKTFTKWAKPITRQLSEQFGLNNGTSLSNLAIRLMKFNKVKKAFELLHQNNEEQFMQLTFEDIDVNGFDGPEEEISSCTFLQLCCMKNLKKAAEYLLQKGADPNKTIPGNTQLPIVIAIRQNMSDFVTKLLKRNDLELPEDILIQIQISSRRKKDTPEDFHYITAILEYIRTNRSTNKQIYIEARDGLKRTPLFHAVHNNNSTIINTLLDLGASFITKDDFGYSPLNNIEPPILEEFLNSCVNRPGEDLKQSLEYEKKKIELEISYENFIDSNAVESEFLTHILKVKHLKEFLLHPVFECYLAFKWKKFRWFCYINLLLYTISYLTLLLYGFGLDGFQEVSTYLLLITLICLVLRESLQTLILGLAKLTELFIDIGLILGIIYILAFGSQSDNFVRNTLVAFSLVFLLSTIGIFLQMSNIEMFSLRVIILRRITFNFVKFVISYIFPILGFIFCFYMLVEKKTKVSFFEATYKTIVMFAGDPDAEYPKTFEENPIFAHIIYVIFVIIIGIILQNLLIGAAVTDLQDIRAEVAYIEKKELAQYITKIEQTVFETYIKSNYKLMKAIAKKILDHCSIFKNKTPTLIIQPYNSGYVYIKGDKKYYSHIRDPVVLSKLKIIFRNITLDDDHDEEVLNVIYEKLENVEKTLQIFSSRPELINKS